MQLLEKDPSVAPHREQQLNKMKTMYEIPTGSPLETLVPASARRSVVGPADRADAGRLVIELTTLPGDERVAREGLVAYELPGRRVVRIARSSGQWYAA